MVGVTMTTEPLIEDLARDWLAAERDESNGRAASDQRSRSTSDAYEVAVHGASREDLLLAWHGALRRQDFAEMGSEEWGYAREVAELLRVEYLASGDPPREPASDEGPPSPPV
jgi:hypothetical protein